MCNAIGNWDQHVDGDLWTDPFSWNGWINRIHFLTLFAEPFGEALQAINRCLHIEFATALHRVQDYYAHTYQGYTWLTGHLLSTSACSMILMMRPAIY